MHPQSLDLFRDGSDSPPAIPLGPGALVLPAYAVTALDGTLFPALLAVLAEAPLRQMQTPGGHTMTVAMSACGRLGWTSGLDGYRYTLRDPLTGRPWPSIPAPLAALARAAAARAGFPGFEPDTCLINRYAAGAKLSPHQDRDEGDLAQPIVSLSIGLPAVFQFGGPSRKARLSRTVLASGDVVVWGGPSRLAYHGVLPLPPGTHPLTGPYRYNLSFRRAAVAERGTARARG